MTHEEALTLKRGDRVSIKYGKGWEPATVLGIYDNRANCKRPDSPMSITVRVRRDGFDRNGRVMPASKRYLNKVQCLNHLDPTAANVFADFLDERGQHVAARMLREAFPRVNEKGEVY